MAFAIIGCDKTEVELINKNAKNFSYGKGILTYSEYTPLSDKPVDIYYYIPSTGNMNEMPVLIVIPGVGRNAEGYLNAWLQIAARKNIMVFSIQFDSEFYDTDSYNLGGIFLDDRLQPEEKWTFSLIDPIFEKIKKDTKSRRSGYDIYGHSAGAQFVHRFLLFKPDSKVERAVVANAGWYTIPDNKVDFPFGINKSPATQQHLKKFFEKKIFVILGTKDTDTNDPNLNTSSGAMLQGKNRYERGHYFWNEAIRIKNFFNYTFNWEQKDIVGVAHSNTQMAPKAAELLY